MDYQVEKKEDYSSFGPPVIKYELTYMGKFVAMFLDSSIAERVCDLLNDENVKPDKD